MIGRRLGHYEIVEKIGEGGMGAVYRARDTTLGRDVALKLLPELLSGDGERVARLEREAHLLASLNHPNIATLHGLEESNGLKYLVMELVAGETLADRIARGPLSIEECFPIFRQIAEGLEAAHEKGVIHRDLKPANIVITPEGRVKVLDFGLAKAAVETPSSDLSKSPTLTREGTEPGVILGTASYMSPEQARGKALDRRTDIWSFGCVFYEALTGRKAFPGETVPDILALTLEKEPDWTELPTSTPRKIRDLLRWCLEKDPHRRLRDIGDARIEIDEPSESRITRPRYRFLPWAAAALASVIAVWSFLRPVAEPKRVVSRFTVNLPREQALTFVNDPSVTLSPDGSRLVYVGGLGDNERRLYVRSLDELEARPIPATEGATSAFFSPDGEWLGFYDTKLKLKKVRFDGLPPITLSDEVDWWGATWAPDDTILFAPRQYSGLSRVPASGGAPSIVTTPDPKQGEVSHRWPQILPDGKTVLVTVLTDTGSFRIGLLSLDTGQHRVLLDAASFARYVPTGHLVYFREEVVVAAPFDLEHLELTGDAVSILEGVWNQTEIGTAHFTFSQDGTLAYVPRNSEGISLVLVNRGGAVRPLTEERRIYVAPRLSPDGQRVAVMIDGHVWIYEIARDVLARVTFGPNREFWPIWTPDGSRLTYRRDDPPNIFWQPANGSGEAERLTTSEKTQRPTSWSPDGKTLVYTEGIPEVEELDMGLLTIDGEPSSHRFLNTTFNEGGGAFSPDGRFLAYVSNESGRNEVYVRTFPRSEGKLQISRDGGVQPVWARSGREIFYRNRDKMMAVPIESSSSFRAGKPALLFEGWFHNSNSVYGPYYDVAPDGEHFVLVQEAPPTQIHVVLNWFEELKERVPTNR
jgi:serine/threonine-protein kinase